jgi:hypothetical protein
MRFMACAGADAPSRLMTASYTGAPELSTHRGSGSSEPIPRAGRTVSEAGDLPEPTRRNEMSLKTILIAAAVALIAVSVASAGGRMGGNSLHATLTGKAETPKGDPDGSGTAEVKITGKSVCWELETAKVAKLTAAHIHKGGPGVAGPVVVPFGATYKSKGCQTTTAAIAAAIKKNPAGYYVNVHNSKYPAGALRGQLSADSM